MFITWHIWNFFFKLTLNDSFIWRFIRKNILKNIYFTLGYNFKTLNFLEKFFFNTFYSNKGFGYFSYNFKNKNDFLTNRIINNRLIYTYITYFAKSDKTKINKNFELLAVEYNFYKNLNKSKRFFFELQRIIVIDFGNFYNYFYIVNNNDENTNNLTNTFSLNFLVYYFFKKNNKFKKLYFYDLSKFSDFFTLFSKQTQKFVVYPINNKITGRNFIKNIYYKYLSFLKTNYISLYKKNFKINFNLASKDIQNFTILKFQPTLFFKINTKWVDFLKNSLLIRYKDSSVTKHIALNDLSKYVIYYLRKNKIFNKGRYSRNRQLYRTGVYWCLYVNILVVYGLYFFFYRFTFNFGYLWIGLFIFFSSFIFSRVCQNRFYNVVTLFNEFINLFKWFDLLLTNVLNGFYNWVYRFLSNFINYIYTFILLNFKINNYKSFYKLINLFSLDSQKKKTNNFVYYWEHFRGEDLSFFKTKTFSHWFKQITKIIIK